MYIEDNCMCSVEHTLNQVELFEINPHEILGDIIRLRKDYSKTCNY